MKTLPKPSAAYIAGRVKHNAINQALAFEDPGSDEYNRLIKERDALKNIPFTR